MVEMWGRESWATIPRGLINPPHNKIIGIDMAKQTPSRDIVQNQTARIQDSCKDKHPWIINHECYYTSKEVRKLFKKNQKMITAYEGV